VRCLAVASLLLAGVTAECSGCEAVAFGCLHATRNCAQGPGSRMSDHRPIVPGETAVIVCSFLTLPSPIGLRSSMSLTKLRSQQPRPLADTTAGGHCHYLIRLVELWRHIPVRTTIQPCYSVMYGKSNRFFRLQRGDGMKPSCQHSSVMDSVTWWFVYACVCSVRVYVVGRIHGVLVRCYHRNLHKM